MLADSEIMSSSGSTRFGPGGILPRHYSELVLQADTELLEFICEENEKDSALLSGK